MVLGRLGWRPLSFSHYKIELQIVALFRKSDIQHPFEVVPVASDRHQCRNSVQMLG